MGENDGTVEVCVLIIGNIELERSIQVDLSTQPDTAEGKRTLGISCNVWFSFHPNTPSYSSSGLQLSPYYTEAR